MERYCPRCRGKLPYGFRMNICPFCGASLEYAFTERPISKTSELLGCSDKISQLQRLYMEAANGQINCQTCGYTMSPDTKICPMCGWKNPAF